VGFADSYPYKGMRECVGILWDKSISQLEYSLFLEFQ
jgi:hypothetical protein